MSTQTAAPKIPEWSFADRLRKIRRDNGMTQAQFADTIGVEVSRYAQWESSANLPRDLVKVAQRIEQETGVPAAWLLGLPYIGPDGAPGYAQVTRSEFVAGSLRNRHEALTGSTRRLAAVA